MCSASAVDIYLSHYPRGCLSTGLLVLQTHVQNVSFWNNGHVGHFLSVQTEAWFKFHGPLRCLAGKSFFGVKHGRWKFAEVANNGVDCRLSQLDMSGVTLASHVSTLDTSFNLEDQLVKAASVDTDNKLVYTPIQESAHVQIHEKNLSKRQFCKRCSKAAPLCICHYIKIVVNNQTAITILQHPREKNHHLGSARIALLGLQNVEIIPIPEVDVQFSVRKRPKVPGSKRSAAGRGGKEAQAWEKDVKNEKMLLKLPGCPKYHPSQDATVHARHHRTCQTSVDGQGTSLQFDSTLGLRDGALSYGKNQCGLVPSWIELQPGAGLLFPSEKAVDLCPVGLKLISSSDSVPTFQLEHQELYGKGQPPSQLIVLDGTWSKAKRIYFENSWLHSLPHYRLPTLQGSRYGWVRREPKPGFLSTIESIVYALQLLEPETKNLGSLLNVFDSMIEDQMRYMVI